MKIDGQTAALEGAQDTLRQRFHGIAAGQVELLQRFALADACRGFVIVVDGVALRKKGGTSIHASQQPSGSDSSAEQLVRFRFRSAVHPPIPPVDRPGLEVVRNTA